MSTVSFRPGLTSENPPSRHTPSSATGCILFVKLWQFDPADRKEVRVNTADIPMRPPRARFVRCVLHEDVPHFAEAGLAIFSTSRHHHQGDSTMKITRIRTLTVAAPPNRNWVFVKVEPNQPELYGWGEGTLEWKTRGVVGTVEDFVPILLGRDPRDVTRIVELLQRTSFRRLGVIGLTALSAIEQACWDIKGKDLGQPVWALLGGKVRDQVRVYTHIGVGKVKIKHHSRDIASYSESTSELREQGYTAVKTGPVPYTHYDFDMREVKHTEQLLQSLRNAAGDEMDILLDFHGRPFSPRGAGLYRCVLTGAPDVRRGANPARRPRRHGANCATREMPDRYGRTPDHA
jgi:hypothetical protein